MEKKPKAPTTSTKAKRGRPRALSGYVVRVELATEASTITTAELRAILRLLDRQEAEVRDEAAA